MNMLPTFPPAFSGHSVLACDDVHDIAVEGAGDRTLGAGDVCWSMDQDRASAAFVLEPDVALETALQMVPVLMVAIGDAIGAIGPPNMPFLYRWPACLVVNGGVAGAVRAAWPDACDAQSVPDWMVVSFGLQLVPQREETGLRPGETALHAEGAGDLDRTMIIEAVARHFLSWIDGWQAGGFGQAHESWLGRATSEQKTIVVDDAQFNLPTKAVIVGLDEYCGLIIRVNGKVKTVPLFEVMGEKRVLKHV